MARDVTVAAANAAIAGHVRPVLFVELDFSSGITYLNSSDRSLVWNGNTYLGAGSLGRVNLNDETSEMQANGIGLELSGVPPEFISIALGEQYQGRRCTIRLGFLDDNYAVVLDPSIEFQGRIDQMSIELGELATISLTAENRLIDWERPRTRLYTDADQQAEYPGDLGMQFVASTVAKKIVWGGSGGGTGATQGVAGDSSTVVIDALVPHIPPASGVDGE